MPRPKARAARLVAPLLALVLVAVACSDGDDDDESTTTTTPPTSAPTDGDDGADGDDPDDDADDGDDTEGDGGDASGAFVAEGEPPFGDDVVTEAIAFVEAETGRTFVDPPRIVAQTDEEYEAGAAELLEEDLDELQEDIDAMARYYQALAGSELGPGELLDAVLDLYSDSDTILGYYVPEDDALFLPVSAGDDPELRVTLVHELVHALDDQYVDLDAMSEEASSDENEGTEAGIVLDLVVEGRASSVEERWRQEQGEGGDGSEEPFELPEVLEVVPPMLVTEIGLPYEFGLAAIEARGGASATWSLLEDTRPETVDALLFDPGGDVSDVDATATLEELHRGAFGVVDIIAVLAGQSLEPDEATVITATEAAVGWAGGEYVVTGDDTESCVVISLAADTDRDLAELEDAFSAWASGDDGRDVSVDGDRVVVDACAPYVS
ncbi:MAG: hypothetical protein S0880_10585 [Actinomycetota bacterium]|nr:hypothetical protein [Actinomycetota bacterium]